MLQHALRSRAEIDRRGGSVAVAEPDDAHVSTLDVMRGRRVAVLYGPTSEEDSLYMREVPREDWSLTALLRVMTGMGIHAEHLDPTEPDFLRRVQDFDLAFVNAHGPYGEDGRLQGMLDYLSMPYTNSGVLASAVGMDKLLTKAAFTELGIATPTAVVIPRGASELPAPMTAPCMIKAANGGSSVGLELLEDPAGFEAVCRRIAALGLGRLFAEEYVHGRSVTVGVLEVGGRRRALTPLECVVGGDASAIYGLKAKLGLESSDSVSYRAPVDVSEALLSSMVGNSQRVFDFLECRGAIRVDFVVTDDTAYALEINTCPGLQRGSNLPHAAALSGLTYEQLVLALLGSTSSNDAPWVQA